MSTSEYESFSGLIDALSRAESAAREIAALRQDQRTGWEQIAGLVNQINDKVMDFAVRGLH